MLHFLIKNLALQSRKENWAPWTNKLGLLRPLGEGLRLLLSPKGKERLPAIGRPAWPPEGLPIRVAYLPQRSQKTLAELFPKLSPLRNTSPFVEPEAVLCLRDLSMKNVVGIFLGIGCIADGRFVHPVSGFPNGLDIAKRCRRNEAAAEGFTPKNERPTG